jgi:ribosomal protein S18 acetylase RimI-like enzyme
VPSTADGVGRVVSEQLRRVEAYYDAVPRALASAEDVGPFTLFRRSGGWPYYARPRAGLAGPFIQSDVERVLARQRVLGLPEAFEWVEEISPQLSEAISSAGLVVQRHQLMVLAEPRPVTAPDGFRVQILDADDRHSLAATRAAVKLGFAQEGTEIGAVGVAERDAEVAAGDQAAEFVGDCIRQGLTTMAAAVDNSGPVAGGSYSPRDGVAEITGVATLPAFRRRGLALAVTSALVEHAAAHGTELCFLSAENDDVAQIYRRLGFVRVATAATAATADG